MIVKIHKIKKSWKSRIYCSIYYFATWKIFHGGAESTALFILYILSRRNVPSTLLSLLIYSAPLCHKLDTDQCQKIILQKQNYCLIDLFTYWIHSTKDELSTEFFFFFWVMGYVGYLFWFAFCLYLRPYSVRKWLMSRKESRHPHLAL